jgi:hypothetical protein
MKMLRHLGLDILAMRFVLTLMVPLVIYVIASLLTDLAPRVWGVG